MKICDFENYNNEFIDAEYSIDLSKIKSIEDIIEVLRICNINIRFRNNDLITNNNKHLIKVTDISYNRY